MTDDRNRLADETSPYLRQHAGNPVDWYPWGDEALERAKKEKKPIFLSVGYSACHWCHVMERESFESDEIAELLNEYFVNVKVDREEHPQIDSIYMDAVQLMSGQGGWPMSVWLTPELEPFYAGTYFPPRGKWGRPGFVDVVEEVHRVWTDEPDRVTEVADKMRDRLEQMADSAEGAQSLGGEPVRSCADGLSRRFDPNNGGFATQPKFPASAQCRLLFRIATHEAFDGDESQRALQMAEKTLVHMASGGMYDHLGGGFHRYSTDERWLIPHFEKMLYDNALLLSAYTEGYQLCERPFYRRIVEETAEYVLREMTDTAGETGGFYSSQDADTEGEEGKFFVWTPDQLGDVLGDEDGSKAAEYWGVTRAGNFEEGKSALHRLDAIDVDDGEFPPGQLEPEMEALRTKLFEAREQRVRPARDDKIIASWNGLMIEALAGAGQTFGRDEWIDAAERAGRFVVDEMCVGDGATELRRTHRDGRTRLAACLDDYANVAIGLVSLYEATGNARWIEDAESLVREMIDDFERPEGGFYYAAEDDTDVLVRQTEIHDGAMPSSTARALEAVRRVAGWTGSRKSERRVERGLKAYYSNMMNQAEATSEMISVLDAHLAGPLEVVCAMGESTDDGESLSAAVREAYLRHGASVLLGDEATEDQPPIADGKSTVDGATAVYICRRGECSAPVIDTEAFYDQIEEVTE